MPSATNPSDGVKIHYEVEGDGPPLLLHHGFTARLEGWREMGYADALKDDYRLVLMDARGHGQSDKPHDAAAYAMDLLVSDVTAVLDDLGADQSHFFGYSMGGYTGFGMLKHAPDRVASLVIGGMHPRGPGAEWFNQRAEELQNGMEAYVAEREAQMGRRMAERRRSSVLANDAEALVASALGSRDTRGLEDGLATATQPCLVFAGDQDDVHDLAQQAADQMPNATFVSLAGLAHLAALTRSDLVLPHVTEFLARVTVVKSPL